MMHLVKVGDSEILVDCENKFEAMEYARRQRIRETGKYQKVKDVRVIDYVLDVKPEPPIGFNFEGRWFDETIYAVDVETTGLKDSKIVEIAVAMFSKEKKGFVPVWQTLVNPEKPIEPGATAINNITDDMVKDAPTFRDIYEQLTSYMPGALWLAHNAKYDSKVIIKECHSVNQDFTPPPFMCSMVLGQRTKLGQKNNKLKTLGEMFEIEIENTHRAMDDTLLCGAVFLKLAKQNKNFIRMNTYEVLRYFDGRQD